jgi:drug/metabolite transporter (DMT)-like permease
MSAKGDTGVVWLTPNRLTLIAFVGIVALGGFNGVAIRFSNRELAPFWGGTLRFGIAAVVLFAYVAARRVPLPRGAALAGSLIYGLLGFGATFGLIYWSLLHTPAGLAQVILALVPLLTLLLAAIQGLEHFRWRSLGGALLALAGIAAVFADRLGSGVPTASMLAMVGAAACMAETNVVVKRFPKCHPAANNAIAMGAGAVVLLAVSFVAGEARAVPAAVQTLVAVGYVSIVGSVVVFSLFLYVISRWSASATSYSMLLMPLVAVAGSTALAGESVTPAFLIGGAIVLAGVYVGAFAPSAPSLLPAASPAPTTAGLRMAAQPATGTPGPATPGCA